MNKFCCKHCDNLGFCNLYSNDAVVWKCKRELDCKGLEIEYPCSMCTMVKYPELCDNKKCREWQQWFIDRWDQMRRYNNVGQ